MRTSSRSPNVGDRLVYFWGRVPTGLANLRVPSWDRFSNLSPLDIRQTTHVVRDHNSRHDIANLRVPSWDRFSNLSPLGIRQTIHVVRDHNTRHGSANLRVRPRCASLRERRADGQRTTLHGHRPQGPIHHPRDMRWTTRSRTTFGVPRVIGGAYRGCRFARPPANFCDPSRGRRIPTPAAAHNGIGHLRGTGFPTCLRWTSAKQPTWPGTTTRATGARTSVFASVVCPPAEHLPAGPPNIAHPRHTIPCGSSDSPLPASTLRIRRRRTAPYSK